MTPAEWNRVDEVIHNQQEHWDAVITSHIDVLWNVVLFVQRPSIQECPEEYSY